MKKTDSPITFVYALPIRDVTGGHKYEAKLRNSLNNCFQLKVKSVFQHEKLNFLSKLLAPLKSLTLLPELKKDKYIVFNSTTGTYFLLLAFILQIVGCKTIVIHHHFIAEELSGLKGVFYGFIEKTFLKTASYIITPSNYIKDLIRLKLKREAYLIPIPFRRPNVITMSPLKGQLLYIGTIEPRKGLSYLLESLNYLNNNKLYHLNIVGKVSDQTYYNTLKNTIVNNKLSVTFHGYLSDEEMSKIICESDVFVFPSLLEGFGMAINEMKFYGLPIICFNNSALPYSVTNGIDGLIIPNKNSLKFAEAIKDVVLDRDLRNKLSHNSLLRAESLTTIEEFYSTANNVFSDIMNI